MVVVVVVVVVVDFRRVVEVARRLSYRRVRCLWS